MIGCRVWAIPEGYIPSQGLEGHDLVSHEAACILNTTDEEAAVEITIYFEDREPCGPYPVTIGPRRTLHLRFNDLSEPAPIPRDCSYSSVLRSNVPVVVQHTRLDSRGHLALLSTLAFPVEAGA